MKKLLFIFCFLPLFINAQNKTEEPKFGINFSGFVKNDFFWDSRQTTNIREGHFLLYPANESLDLNGHDINDRPNLNFLSIQSRLTGKITGPDAFKAKTSGLIEADFFGNEVANIFSDVNGFRLRHAFVKLNWKSTEFLFGQYWHPMFVADCFPGVVSFNTGSPFQPFSRNPQIRLTQKFGGLSIIAVANTQRDFVSPGGSSITSRNSAIPEFSLQLTYGMKNDSTKTEFLAGLGGGYKTLVPRLYADVYTTVTTPAVCTIDTATMIITHTETKTTYTPVRHKVSEEISGYTAIAFLKLKLKPVTVRYEAVYGQNLFDLTMIGGYATSEITDKTADSRIYTPLNTLSTWLELQTNGEKFQVGLFAGYTQNMGADKDIVDYTVVMPTLPPATVKATTTAPTITTTTTSRGSDIHHIYRIAPRFVFISGKVQLATEIEYTTAAFMTKDDKGVYNRDSKGVITGYKDISNLRALFAVIYKF